jgi:hypothetical protein
MSGVTPKACAPNTSAAAAEAGDHLVEDQQDIVLRADLAQALQVAHWAARSRRPSRRRARRSRPRCSRRRAALTSSSSWSASSSARCSGIPRENCVCGKQRVRQVIGIQRVAEQLAVAADAAQADAAEVHAVVALGAADERVLLGWPFWRQ